MKCSNYGCDNGLDLPEGAVGLAVTTCSACRWRAAPSLDFLGELRQAMHDPKWDDDYEGVPDVE